MPTATTGNDQLVQVKAVPDKVATPTVSTGLGWTIAFLFVLTLLWMPLFVIQFPPLLDLPNHLSRLYILSTNGRDLVLSRIWQPDWHIIPNLAIDAFGPMLINMSSPSTASLIILMLAVAAQLSGAVLLHRSIFQKQSYFPLLAAMFIYNDIFLQGFLNYLLGVGVAMLGASAWLAQAPYLARYRILISVLFSVLIFFCHIVAAAFYLLLIGSWELSEAPRYRTTFLGFFKRLSVLLFPLLTISALYKLSPLSSNVGTLGWPTIQSKIAVLLNPFFQYSTILDLSIVCIAATIFGYLLWNRKVDVPRGTLFTFIILLAAFFLCPRSAGAGNSLDTRLPVLLAFVLVTGVNVIDTPPLRKILLATFGAIIFSRQLFLGYLWFDARTDLDDFLSLGSFLYPGARVLAATVEADDPIPSCKAGKLAWQLHGLFQTKPVYWHLPGYWVIQQRVFWPGLFHDPSQQPIRVLPPYSRDASSSGVPIDYRKLLSTTDTESSAFDWIRDFDFIVLLSNSCSVDFLKAPVDLIKQTAIASLYSIRK